MAQPPASTRFALVTGASTGIGRACALYLASLGLTVFAGVRSESAAADLRSAGGERVEPVQLDVTDAGSIASAARQIRDKAGAVGVAGLVNNAGIAVAGPLEYLPIDDLRHQLEVNVTGQVAVTQALLPLLRCARGRVVFMSSVSGIMSVPLLGAYSASKFALEAVADTLRLELAGSGVHVALIEPGNISTPIWAKGREQTTSWQERSPEAIARYERHIKAIERVTYAGERHGDPPMVVARAVAHALLAPRPRTRYLVARGAGMMPLLRLVPDRLRDWMVLRSFGL